MRRLLLLGLLASAWGCQGGEGGPAPTPDDLAHRVQNDPSLDPASRDAAAQRLGALSEEAKLRQRLESEARRQPARPAAR